jgi:hypothetical protein
MKTTTIVLVAGLALMAMAASPAAAEDMNPNEDGLWCVDVSINPVGVAVDPRCLENLLPPPPSATDRD